jgi:dihydrofolate synthase/folylpolyglutamate synthase
MSESILRAAGRRTGLFTSPHLVRVNERIRVAGRPISSPRFTEIAHRVIALERGLLRRREIDRPLTYFELVTACAFAHFAASRIDIAVIEVGLGGRLDATNVISPSACVITGVSLDHQDILGNTLLEIAREKAGIVKPGVPVVSGCRRSVPREVVRREAERLGARLIELDRVCKVKSRPQPGGFFRVEIRTPAGRYPNLKLSLAGRHQVRNAAAAILALEAMQCVPGIVALRRGLAGARWPGRLDAYRLPRRTLLDGAHNAEAARIVAGHLREFGPKDVRVVFGILRDKDVASVGESLFPLARAVHLAPIENPRAMEPSAIAASFPRYEGKMRVHRSAREALRTAWRECPRAGLVLVAGSLYLVGALLPLVRRRNRVSLTF